MASMPASASWDRAIELAVEQLIADVIASLPTSSTSSQPPATRVCTKVKKSAAKPGAFAKKVLITQGLLLKK